MYYEVLWFTDENYDGYECISFKTKKQAMAFYEEHKNDSDKYNWWVTKRNKDDEVIQDLIS